MGKGSKSHTASGREPTLLEEIDLNFSPDELREFLAGDLLEDTADPQFKERLRARLWGIVSKRQPTTPGDDE